MDDRSDSAGAERREAEGREAEGREAETLAAALAGTAVFGADDVEIRGLVPGDLGWVISRHGAIYAGEYGWNEEFETLVARICVEYREQFKPGREHAWIATVSGARAGCVFCVERDTTTAQLRLLIAERWARGLGVGRRLVRECIDFARDSGYEVIVLWTNDVLHSARRIYEELGFVLTDADAHHSFGVDLIGQYWRLDLT